jgi:uncharacterized membrane protein (UPF0127 family)
LIDDRTDCLPQGGHLARLALCPLQLLPPDRDRKSSMILLRNICTCLLLALLPASIGAGPQVFVGNAFAQAQPAELATDPEKLIARTSSGEYAFSLEIADEEFERERGLMFRQTMAADHGMLFDFGRTEVVSMWMRNTPMALDMVFIRQDGTVARIAERTQPFSDDIVTSQEPVAYVLELRAGVSRLIGLKPGDQLRHKAIRQ